MPSTEPCSLNSLRSRQLIQMLEVCYGLTHGPFAWYTHNICRYLVEELGYAQSRADPCIFFFFTEEKGKTCLKGIRCLATDDMIHGGDEYHLSKMNQIQQQKYKLGKFKFDQGRFCGKDIIMNPDYSIDISQTVFV